MSKAGKEAVRSADVQLHLEVSPEEALFGHQVEGLVVAFHENERPLQGLAGLLDWRFHGAISRALRSGAITGRAGECVYFPIARHGHTYHLILVGAGSSRVPGERHLPPAETLRQLKSNLTSLKLNHVGISRSDLGSSEDFIQKQFKGVALWILK